MDVDRRRLDGAREQLIPRPRDWFINRAADEESPLIERRVRRRTGRQDGEVADDVLARREARTIDLRAVISKPS
jgi:hypothetical protein